MSFAEYARALARQERERSRGLVVVEETASTQLLARQIVREYSPTGSGPPQVDLFAWHQTAGMGREGRRWSSPGGCGVYATLIRPLTVADEAACSSLQLLPLLVGAELCAALNRHFDRYLAAACRLRWPNDLMVDGRKLGGLLLDVITQGSARTVLLLGVGVNVGADLAAFDEPRATALGAEQPDAGPAPALDRVARVVVDAVDRALTRRETPEETVARYQELSLHRPGETIRCRSREGEVEGIFRGFDPHGFLRLEVDGKERKIHTPPAYDGEDQQP